MVVWCAAAQQAPPDPAAGAADAFARNDCASAVGLYQAALALQPSPPDWSKAALYNRRIGICAYRAGEIDDSLAAYQRGIAAAESARDSEMLLENLHGASVALRHLGRLTEALDRARRALDLAQTCGHPPHLSRALSQMAILLGDAGQSARALEFFERLLDFARANHDPIGETNALDNLAIAYGDMGDREAGIRLLRQRLAATAPDDSVGLGRTYNNLGMQLRQSGRLAEAQQAYEGALRYAERPEEWRTRDALLINLGELQVDQGNLAGARKTLERCLEGLESGRDPRVQAYAQTALAKVLLALKQNDAAARMAAAAAAGARRSQSPPALFPALAALGMAEESAGHVAEAGAALEEGVAVVEALRAAAPGDPHGLEAVLKDGHQVYQSLVAHLLRQGRVEDALLWVEKAKARVLNDILLKGGVDERGSMSDEERREERALYRRVAASAADRKQSQEAIGDLEVFRHHLYARHPELALQRGDFAPAGPREWRQLLPGPRSALVEFFQLPDSLALFVVRERSVTVSRLNIAPARLAAEIRRLHDQVAARDVNYTAGASSLYRALLAPAAARLADTDRWILSPDGMLWELPFQALVDAHGQHLLETISLSYTPSLTALWQIRRRELHAAAAPLELLALGNPAGATPLPEAEDEARRIGQLYAAADRLVLTGADARQDRFREQAPRARVIHIAAHAQLNSANPMYSTLDLGAPMPAGDILRLPLRARLAVLSACETARGKALEGEELLGMGWALTGAGAAASVVSHWKVDSAATEALMVAFHTQLRKGLPPADALRRAALEVRALPGERNPFYWAAFLVLGDGFR
jgi:CHAT domain-containing protein